MVWSGAEILGSNAERDFLTRRRVSGENEGIIWDILNVGIASDGQKLALLDLDMSRLSEVKE